MDCMTLKFCLGCGRWLPLSAYHARKDRNIAIYPRCAECVKAKATWGQIRQREAEGAQPHYTQERSDDTATCRQCGERKPIADFAPGRRGRGNGWVCRQCQRQHWQRDNERRRRLRQQRKAQPIVIEVDLPSGHYDDLYMAGGIILHRTQHQATIPGARLYVDIWQGTDPATGQLVQGWRWAMWYD